MNKTALFSLYDTAEAVDFARSLTAAGWRVLASRETSSILDREGIPCTDISSYVDITYNYGIPPTLHPKIEAALTMENSTERIDLVYVVSYPRSVGNDVGGRVLVALAAKGRRIPVIEREDMRRVVAEICAHGDIPDELRAALIDKANASISTHYLELVKRSGRGDYDGQVGQQVLELQNGENPYQAAGLFAVPDNDPLALHRLHNLSETPPCFTNLADTDAVINTLCLADAAFMVQFGKRPFLAMGAKHGNVCGASFDWESPIPAVEKTLFGNPLAVWGGELAVNFAVEEDAAQIMVRHPRREAMLGSAGWMLDVVIAPSYSPASVEALLKRKFRKVFANPALSAPFPLLEGFSYRFVRGGFIRQSPPWRVLRLSELEPASSLPEGSDAADLILAWAAAFTSFHGGNEIAIVKDGGLVGVGGGPSTVQAAQVAVERARQAGHDLQGSVFCADAFFPFTDAPQVLIDAGVKMGCVPAGGKNEPLVRQAFEQAGVAMYYLPEDFRGFCRH